MLAANISAESVGTLLGIAQGAICDTTGVVSKRRKELLTYSPRNPALISFQRQEMNDEKYAALFMLKLEKQDQVAQWAGEL